jgi:predicted nucleic acid-binding protein
VKAAVFALDTSCIIAAVCAWHERHEAAADAISKRLDRGDSMAVAAHALMEAYAVLTRLPAPHRLSPVDAWTVLSANFAEERKVLALSARELVAVLARLAAAGIAGGRTYDAVIGECAVRSGASVLLTFNPRHFEPPPAGVTVVVPTG